MAKLITVTLSIPFIVVIGTIVMLQMDKAAVERHRQAAAAEAARLKAATHTLDEAMKDGSAGIAGTVVTHLRHDKNQINDLIAALKLTGTEGTTGARKAQPAAPTPGPTQAPERQPRRWREGHEHDGN